MVRKAGGKTLQASARPLTKSQDAMLPGFLEYQREANKTNQLAIRGPEGAIAPMLGLASETGSILDSHKRYLRDAIDFPANQEFLKEELGDLLWYIAAVASACSLSLSSIATNNLQRVAKLYGAKAPRLQEEIGNKLLEKNSPNQTSLVSSSFRIYQERASKTSLLTLRGPQGPVAPMLGLANATGTILNSHKKYLRDRGDFRANRQFLHQELGDALWYLAAVATACELDLGIIADENIARAQDYYRISSNPLPKAFKAMPSFDGGRDPTERFPRRMVIWIQETPSPLGPPVASQTLIAVAPNAFPNGPITLAGEKVQGFSVEALLGDTVTDNSRKRDGYRYHDAIHIAFMAVLGWSPTMRSLLNLRRRSDENINRDEDGARAKFTEEGLAAMLSKLSRRRMGFLGENHIDGIAIELVKGAVQDLEVRPLPGWMWRRAISQGFRAMHQLTENKGGYLVADLDKRELKYSKFRPELKAVAWSRN